MRSAFHSSRVTPPRVMRSQILLTNVHPTFALSVFEPLLHSAHGAFSTRSWKSFVHRKHSLPGVLQMM